MRNRSDAIRRVEPDRDFLAAGEPAGVCAELSARRAGAWFNCSLGRTIDHVRVGQHAIRRDDQRLIAVGAAAPVLAWAAGGSVDRPVELSVQIDRGVARHWLIDTKQNLAAAGFACANVLKGQRYPAIIEI